MKLDELLAGTIDLHCHVYPEMTLEHEARQDDIDLIEGALKARMGGVLLKSHFWPTVDRVYYLRKRFPDIGIFSCITLPIRLVCFRYAVARAKRDGSLAHY